MVSIYKGAQGNPGGAESFAKGLTNSSSINLGNVGLGAAGITL